MTHIITTRYLLTLLVDASDGADRLRDGFTGTEFTSANSPTAALLVAELA